MSTPTTAVKEGQVITARYSATVDRRRLLTWHKPVMKGTVRNISRAGITVSSPAITRGGHDYIFLPFADYDIFITNPTGEIS